MVSCDLLGARACWICRFRVGGLVAFVGFGLGIRLAYAALRVGCVLCFLRLVFLVSCAI